MKKIKIKLVGFWDGFKLENQLFYKILTKHYLVELSDNPDYIICSCFGKPYEYCSYDQVRIMFVGENYIPDLNFIDYAITRYPIQFGDRCFGMFDCLDENTHAKDLSKVHRDFDASILSEKKFFANFIAGHESEKNIRGDFFKSLCNYRRVESPGTYLNNMEGDYVVDFKNNSKIDFQKKCKFTLCFESTQHYGFVTEKIVDAYLANTVPIYFGSSTINTIFNPKSFINVADFNCFDDVIAYIKKIDQNDDLYLEMLNQPIFNDDCYIEHLHQEFEKFLVNIFDQDVENSYRRSKVYCPKKIENYIMGLNDYQTMMMRIPIRKLPILIAKRIIMSFKYIFMKNCGGK